MNDEVDLETTERTNPIRFLKGRDCPAKLWKIAQQRPAPPTCLDPFAIPQLPPPQEGPQACRQSRSFPVTEETALARDANESSSRQHLHVTCAPRPPTETPLRRADTCSFAQPPPVSVLRLGWLKRIKIITDAELLNRCRVVDREFAQNNCSTLPVAIRHSTKHPSHRDQTIPVFVHLHPLSVRDRIHHLSTR